LSTDGHEEKGNFLLDFFADILQNPTRKPGVCPYLRGRQGTGKTAPVSILRRIVGPKNVLTTSEKDRIFGRFNSAIANKILAIGEEMFFHRDHAATDKLKHFLTGSTAAIEYKFGDAIEIDSYHRLILMLNHEQVVQAANEERRFVIYEVNDKKRGDFKYFDKLYAISDGRDTATAQAFMHFLLHRDLSDFRPWHAQQQLADDPALVRQKALSLSPPLAWLREVADAVVGQGPAGDYNWVDGLPVPVGQFGPTKEYRWPPRFTRRQAVDAFRDWTAKAKPFGASEFTSSEQRFWSEICKVIPHRQTTRQGSGGVRFVIIDFNDLQNNFSKYLRGEVI
jgi:hypothetical protein